jgi:hypothetical protein
MRYGEAMRKPLLALGVALGTTLLAASPADAKAPASASGPLRDPAGVKGISPYQEIIAKGRKAVQAQELDAALAAFQEAVQTEPKATLGHLLLAQTQLLKGDQPTATKTIAEARATQGPEDVTSKLLMLTADLDERAVPGTPAKPTIEALQPKIDQARTAWEGYASFAAGHTKAPDYRATATERKKQLDARLEREKAYLAVKQRIADNIAEGAREAEKSAAADAAKNK